MTEPAATTVTETKVEHGQPSELPEPKYLWRRVFSMAATVLTDALLLVIVLRTKDPDVLKPVAIGGLIYNLTVACFYIGGATMTDIWRVVSAVRTSRTETVTETKASPAG